MAFDILSGSPDLRFIARAQNSQFLTIGTSFDPDQLQKDKERIDAEKIAKADQLKALFFSDRGANLVQQWSQITPLSHPIVPYTNILAEMTLEAGQGPIKPDTISNINKALCIEYETVYYAIRFLGSYRNYCDYSDQLERETNEPISNQASTALKFGKFSLNCDDPIMILTFFRFINQLKISGERREITAKDINDLEALKNSTTGNVHEFAAHQIASALYGNAEANLGSDTARFIVFANKINQLFSQEIVLLKASSKLYFLSNLLHILTEFTLNEMKDGSTIFKRDRELIARLEELINGWFDAAKDRQTAFGDYAKTLKDKRPSKNKIHYI